MNNNGIEGQIELSEERVERGSLMEAIYGQVRKAIRESCEQGLILHPVQPVQVSFTFSFSEPEDA